MDLVSSVRCKARTPPSVRKASTQSLAVRMASTLGRLERSAAGVSVVAVALTLCSVSMEASLSSLGDALGFVRATFGQLTTQGEMLYEAHGEGSIDRLRVERFGIVFAPP